MAIEKPTVGQAGWNAAVDALIDVVNGVPVLPMWTPGLYYPPTAGTATAPQTLGLNTLRIGPLTVPADAVLSALVIEVTTSAVGALLRSVLYTDDGTGKPGALVVDAGQVDASSTGFKTADFADLPLPAGHYWVGAVSQGANDPTIRTVTGQTPGLGMSPPSSSSFIGYQSSGITAAAPATFPASPGASSNMPRVLALAGTP